MRSTEWSHVRLCLLFTPELCRRDPWDTLDAALDAGVDVVQWRVKHRDADALHRCLRACTARGVPLVVNDDVELARDTACAGTHVGQEDMPARQARALLGTDRVLGVSTHDLAQARAAIAAGADYLGLGPCFPTRTKGYAVPTDRAVLRDVLGSVRLPVFAIGGVDADNAIELFDLGFRHLAVSAAILGAERPARVVERLLGTLRL